MTEELIMKIITLIFVPCLFVTFAIPFVRKLAFHIKAIDEPNPRKVHHVPIARLGGLGIYFGFLFGYMLFGISNPNMNAILIGSFVIVLTGVIDDISPLKPSHKFVGQLVSALIIAFYGKILLQDISAFGIYINFHWLAYPITVFFILGCINCMNLIDGLDGLAGGISSIFFLSIGIIAACKAQFGIAFLLSFIMVGSCIGFLIHNFYPASIFMGDSGSMFLGFMISVITLLGFKNVMMTSIIVPLLMLTIPISDTLFAIVRRKLKGESISTPDKMHIHHQLLKRHLSQRTTVLLIYLMTLLFSIASMIYVLVDNNIGYICYGILLFIVFIFALKTDVIFDHTQSHQKIDGDHVSSQKQKEQQKKMKKMR